ncbi:MAG: MFS transporter [Tumebacillaceae bacterium]
MTIWQNRTFLKMFSAFSLSTFGDWFDAIAMMVLLSYTWQADPMLLALIPLTFALPSVLFSQVAGILADRLPKLRLMIISDLLRAVVTALLIFAPGPFTALALITLRSLAGVFNLPAQQSLTRHVVAEHHLLKATSLNGLVSSMAKVLGPLLGASLMAVASPELLFGINSASYVLSALLLVSIGRPVESEAQVAATAEAHADAPKQKQSMGEMWREGWGVVFRNRLLLASVVFMLVGFTAVQFIDYQFTTVFREVAPDNYALPGWYIAMIGLGSVCSITYLNRLDTIKNHGWVLGGGLFLVGIMVGSIGLMKPGMNLWMPLLCAFFGGIGNGMANVGGNYFMQKEIPKEMLGRVFGIFESVRSALFIVAPLTGGVLVQSLGPFQTFQITSVALLVIGAIGILFQRLIWKQ